MLSATVNLLIGIALLTTGRRLFWVFVGAAGFLFASSLANEYLSREPEWVALAISMVAGLIGVALAIFAQRFAVGAAGFVLGSYAMASLCFAIGLYGTGWMWMALLGGGIIGAVLSLAVLDFALIFLSSVAGAMLIVQTVHLNPNMSFALFAVLFGMGVAIQVRMLRK